MGLLVKKLLFVEFIFVIVLLIFKIGFEKKLKEK